MFDGKTEMMGRSESESPTDAEPISFEDCDDVISKIVEETTGSKEGIKTIGPYRVKSQISRGGMGTVYLATRDDPLCESQFAIKVMRDEADSTRFEQEIRLLSRLDHDNLLWLIDYGEHDGYPFFVMRYVPGPSLRDVVRALGCLPIPDACEIIYQIANVLAYCHDEGCIHRDVKPSNVMLTQHGVAKLGDFGVSLMVDSRLTVTGATMGSYDYMAPEVIRDAKHANELSDIYSLGCTFYELLTGSPPFADLSRDSLLEHHATVEPQWVSECRPVVPEKLAALLDRMLQKNPEDRPSSMRSVAAGVAAFRVGADLQAVHREYELHRDAGISPNPERRQAITHPQEAKTNSRRRPKKRRRSERLLGGLVRWVLMLSLICGAVFVVWRSFVIFAISPRITDLGQSLETVQWSDAEMISQSRSNLVGDLEVLKSASNSAKMDLLWKLPLFTIDLLDLIDQNATANHVEILRTNYLETLAACSPTERQDISSLAASAYAENAEAAWHDGEWQEAEKYYVRALQRLAEDGPASAKSHLEQWVQHHKTRSVPAPASTTMPRGDGADNQPITVAATPPTNSTTPERTNASEESTAESSAVTEARSTEGSAEQSGESNTVSKTGTDNPPAPTSPEEESSKGDSNVAFMIATAKATVPQNGSAIEEASTAGSSGTQSPQAEIESEPTPPGPRDNDFPPRKPNRSPSRIKPPAVSPALQKLLDDLEGRLDEGGKSDD